MNILQRFFKPETEQRSVNAIIEEIHETFFTEVDRLLEEAKISHSLESEMQDLLDKHERLKALGFSNANGAKDVQNEKMRLVKLQQENEAKVSLIKAINYFSTKYPAYKFITEKSVKRICEKYGLIYGTVDKYIGNVPDINLKHIENFKINVKDVAFTRETEMNRWGGRGIRKEYSFDFLSYDLYMKHTDLRFFRLPGQTYYKSPLEIAAPIKDFNLDKHEVKNFKIVKKKVQIPDPIVLQPVFYEGQKHYLIVTAWGLEASDEEVINPRHN